MKLPERYTEQMKELLGDAYEAYLASFEETPANCIRVNTAKISIEEFLQIAPFALTPVPWCPSGFYYGEQDRPGTHPYYYAGLYYMQEASAMIPAQILPIAEGDIVLDACCAPGGKSTALAARLNGTGVLMANDISASRQNATLKNMERFGVRNAYITAADLNRIADVLPEYFDKVLLDAPCSGEGMFRRDPSLIKAWEEKDSSFYAPLQKQLADAAVRCLKPGGMLVYSTCTFSPQEDEEVLLDLCRSHPDMHIVPVPERYERFRPGVLPGTEDCLRLYPHELHGEGHFAALLRKDGTAEKIPLLTKPGAVPKQMREFASLLDSRLLRGVITVRNEQVYVLHDKKIADSGLRMVRSGLLLGSVRGERFEPSQALAFACRADDFANTVRFAADDPRVWKYLRGETITCEEGRDGWVLVCLDRWPLGFGKKQSKTIKNKIQKGYRML